MKIINLTLGAAALLMLASCGGSPSVGTPEEAGAQAAQMEFDMAMTELDQKEQINNLKIERDEFELKVEEKYGSDPTAAAGLKKGAAEKAAELRPEYEKRKIEVKQKREAAKEKLEMELKEVLDKTKAEAAQ